MVIAPVKSLSLKQFLEMPETKPASEYINGQIYQKPMPQGKHSIVQTRLSAAVNQTGIAARTAHAFTELRCTFGDRSLIPDIAVFEWSRIPFDSDGEIPNDFLIYPDWTIEILSPAQGSNRVTGNILHCLRYGCRLGWLVDPGDRSILAFLPKQEPVLYEGDDRLPVLEEISLELTVNQVFGWLKMSH